MDIIDRVVLQAKSTFAHSTAYVLLAQTNAVTLCWRSCSCVLVV